MGKKPHTIQFLPGIPIDSWLLIWYNMYYKVVIRVK